MSDQLKHDEGTAERRLKHLKELESRKVNYKTYVDNATSRMRAQEIQNQYRRYWDVKLDGTSASTFSNGFDAKSQSTKSQPGKADGLLSLWEASKMKK